MDHGPVLLEVHEGMQAIVLAESFNRIAAVLPDTFDEVGRDSDVQHAARPVGQDVNGGMLGECQFRDPEAGHKSRFRVLPAKSAGSPGMTGYMHSSFRVPFAASSRTEP